MSAPLVTEVTEVTGSPLCYSHARTLCETCEVEIKGEVQQWQTGYFKYFGYPDRGD